MNDRGRLSEDRRRIGPLDIRLRLFEEVLELRRKSHSHEEMIAKMLQKHQVRLPRSTVSCWTNGVHTPFGWINLFKSKPTPELAYIIGGLVGDASLNMKTKHHQYRVRLKTVVQEFVEAFDHALSKVLKCPPHRLWKSHTGREYHLEVGSFILHMFLHRSLEEFRPFIEHSPRCVSALLKGFFDSEGCVLENGDTTASDTDVGLPKYVQELLFRFFGIETSGPHLTKRKGSVILRNGKTYLRNFDCYSTMCGELVWWALMGSLGSRYSERFRDRSKRSSNLDFV